MKIEKNCHTAARITGSVPDETGESPAFHKLEGSCVTISAADEMGNKANPPIFCGFIRNVEIWQEGNGYQARIDAISPTELLDLEEKSRSFQKINMTYKEFSLKRSLEWKGYFLKSLISHFFCFPEQLLEVTALYDSSIPFLFFALFDIGKGECDNHTHGLGRKFAGTENPWNGTERGTYSRSYCIRRV